MHNHPSCNHLVVSVYVPKRVWSIHMCTCRGRGRGDRGGKGRGSRAGRGSSGGRVKGSRLELATYTAETEMPSSSVKCWNTTANPDVIPSIPPIRQPGHHWPIADPANYTPSYMFRLFFTDEIVNSIVENTNTHATQSRVKVGSMTWSLLRKEHL